MNYSVQYCQSFFFGKPPLLYEEYIKEQSLCYYCFTGEGQYPDEAEDRLPPPGSPYYLADPSQLW